LKSQLSESCNIAKDTRKKSRKAQTAVDALVDEFHPGS
jgi:hypothetical protein